MAEVFETDVAGETPNADADVQDVVSYMAAMRWALEQLNQLPLSTRLLCEIHGRLIAGVRGAGWSRGSCAPARTGSAPQVRRSRPRCSCRRPRRAAPVAQRLGALRARGGRGAAAGPERAAPFVVRDDPALPRGNGRVGRLLLVFSLVARGRLTAPLLYLRTYLEFNRQSYYEALQTIHETGDPIPWIELFLTAVQTQACDAVARAEGIIDLRERYRQAAAAIGTLNSLALVELICENPIVTTRSIEARLGVSRPTALRLLRRMEEQGVLTEGDAGPRGQRRYVAREMMDAVAGDASG